MEIDIIDNFIYRGLFQRYNGLELQLIIHRNGSKIKRVIVIPNLDTLDVFVPNEIKPEISNFVREIFDYQKEPLYINPRLN